MAKKCIMCGEKADYCIKDTSDYYCEECAKESFNDISVLLKVEEQAQRLKEVIKEKMKEELKEKKIKEESTKKAEKQEISKEEKTTEKENKEVKQE